MDIDNSARGAPRGSIARSPTGFRRLTPGLLKVDRTADGFVGLPDGVTVPGQLLAALKTAAPRLGVSPRLVHAVDWLFRFTQPQARRGGLTAPVRFSMRRAPQTHKNKGPARCRRGDPPGAR
jgi:Replication protein C N-terminal domain